MRGVRGVGVTPWLRSHTPCLSSPALLPHPSPPLPCLISARPPPPCPRSLPHSGGADAVHAGARRGAAQVAGLPRRGGCHRHALPAHGGLGGGEGGCHRHTRYQLTVWGEGRWGLVFNPAGVVFCSALAPYRCSHFEPGSCLGRFLPSLPSGWVGSGRSSHCITYSLSDLPPSPDHVSPGPSAPHREWRCAACQ